MKKIIFKDFTEVKPHLSGVNSSFSLDSALSSFRNAIADITDVTGTAVYEAAVEHYEGEHYNVEGQTDDTYLLWDNIVFLMQAPLANFAFYRHYPLLIAQIGNAGVTIEHSDDRKTVGKQLSEEIKAQFIESAWQRLDELVVFLKENEVTEFTDSDEHADIDSLPVSSPAQFKRITGVKSAAFFYKVLHILRRIEHEELLPRINDFEALKSAIKNETNTDAQASLWEACQYFLAWQATAEAVKEFSFHELPAPIRRLCEHENNFMSQQKAQSPDNLYAVRRQTAQKYLRKIELLAQNDSETPQTASNLNKAENKYVLF